MRPAARASLFTSILTWRAPENYKLRQVQLVKSRSINFCIEEGDTLGKLWVGTQQTKASPEAVVTLAGQLSVSHILEQGL